MLFYSNIWEMTDLREKLAIIKIFPKADTKFDLLIFEQSQKYGAFSKHKLS